MIFEGGIGIGEDDPFVREVFFQAAVDDFRFVLGFDAGEVFLFGFGNAQAIVRVANVFGDVAPIAFLSFRSADEVIDVLKIELAELAAPIGHRLLEENGQRIEPELGHPGRLVLHLARSAARSVRRAPCGS